MKINVLPLLLSLTSISATCILANANPAELNPAQPPAEFKKAASPLEGAWLLAESWEGTERGDVDDRWVQFVGNKIISHESGDKETGSFVVDKNRKQLTITIDEEKLKVFYNIEKDTLTLCFTEEEELPENFDKEEGKYLLHFQLMKPVDKKFQGMWTCEELWEGNEKADDEEMQEYSFKIGPYLFETYDNDELNEANGEVVEPDESFILTINERTNKMQLNQTGETFNCIYKFENGSLIIHFIDNASDEKNADYPKDFKITPDSILLKLKMKPAQ